MAYAIPASAASCAQTDIKVLILGDSLSAAYNIPIEQSWPVLFQKKLGNRHLEVALINASITGETTHGGLERLPGLLTKHQPSHLIIELGGNDGLRGLRFAEAEQNIQKMIDMAEARSIEILLIGVRLPPNLGPVYNLHFQKVFKSLSENNDIEYLPKFLAGVAADLPEYMQADGIHPTVLAQPILADKVDIIFQTRWCRP